MIDTDRCIQKLVRTEPEGSEHAQCKLEETVQYWVAQEKEAAMNYRCALELNNSVSNKRVQQLYSQDQSQEVIDKAERQASSVRRTLENIRRVDEAGLSRNSPKHPRTPRIAERDKYARDDMQVKYVSGDDLFSAPKTSQSPSNSDLRYLWQFSDSDCL